MKDDAALQMSCLHAAKLTWRPPLGLQPDSGSWKRRLSLRLPWKDGTKSDTGRLKRQIQGQPPGRNKTSMRPEAGDNDWRCGWVSTVAASLRRAVRQLPIQCSWPSMKDCCGICGSPSMALESVSTILHMLLCQAVKQNRHGTATCACSSVCAC